MKLIVNHKKFDVQLAKNTTALAFEQLLPISLDMEELNGNEKYAYLGEALPSAPQCPTQIHAGDIMLFGGNCLVIFTSRLPHVMPTRASVIYKTSATSARHWAKMA